MMTPLFVTAPVKVRPAASPRILPPLTTGPPTVPLPVRVEPGPIVRFPPFKTPPPNCRLLFEPFVSMTRSAATVPPLSMNCPLRTSSKAVCAAFVTFRIPPLIDGAPTAPPVESPTTRFVFMVTAPPLWEKMPVKPGV